MNSLSLVAWLACLWGITPTHAFLGVPGAQQPLILATSTPTTNYSVGFSLASSYGSAAVIIDNALAEKETRTWVVYGDDEYQAVMARLSLESSRHLAPPYGDMDEYFKDIPRVMARRTRKKAGLPASHDVGVLSGVIRELRSQIESDLGITISDATLTTTHLEALYQDDVEDICEYAKLKYIIPKAMFHPILWEASSAYAGYGFGLCKHWRNDTRCQEELFPSTHVLAVHYSRTALTSTLATIRTAIGALEPLSMRMVSFELGWDARKKYASEQEYWRNVKAAIVQRMVETPAMEKPKSIVLTGDMVDGEFRKALEEAVMEHMGRVPPVFAQDALVVAAKGAAEFRRRGQAKWQ
ncbi:hypothetical protein OIDMADRAFT_146091 [Oidiodendron maius Zn]|uniref:Uncharacterized protein n=1 Tax=Oidiodendron maius (strain Zn) TaxID=913774 RepID=A0A0C3GXC7_OIDMZ|nr:hypothetical protein OIDMADRAFT_146091 [Oidiodendron maius Zn]